MNYLKPSIFTLLSFFILLSGCSKKDDIKIEKIGRYKLEDIQWILKEGDGEEILEVEVPRELFKNEGDSVIKFVSDPLKNLKGSSVFQFELPDDPRVKLDSVAQLVSVTAYIDLLSESYSHLVGGTKVPFQAQKSYFPFSVSIIESTDLRLGTQIEYETTVFLKKNTATFKARFVNLETLETFELIGKWTGVFYQYSSSNSVVSEI